MGELWDFLPAGGVQRFAFDAAWQSTLVCLIGIGLARHGSPATRRSARRFCLPSASCASPRRSPRRRRRYGGWGVFTFAESTDPVRAFGAIPVATEGHPRPVVHAATVPAAVAMPRDGAGASLLDGTRWALGISWCAGVCRACCCGSGMARGDSPHVSFGATVRRSGNYRRARKAARDDLALLRHC